MDRRQFLGAAAGTVAGASAIGWLGHYFLGTPAWAGDDESKKAVAAMGNVAEAYRRAQSVGKPLLVLVIPADEGAGDDEERKYLLYERMRERGHIFGALLNHGGNGAYLDLALCELVCATAADAAKQIKDVKVEGEPLMLLVDTGATACATPIDPQISNDESNARTRGGSEKLDELAKAQLDKVAAALRAVVAPDRKTLEERAALAEAHLAPDRARALRADVAAGKTPEPELLDHAAAIARAVAENPEARRPQVLDALAAAAAKRVTGTAPPGAKWAKSSGCGVDVEGEEPEGVECGMGYVPQISQRFLWFFTQ